MSSRFYRQQRQNRSAQLLARVQAHADHASQCDWDVQMIDHAVVRAHPRTAGVTKGTSTKRSIAGVLRNQIHLKCDGRGSPLAVLLTAGHRHEMVTSEALWDARLNDGIGARPDSVPPSS